MTRFARACSAGRSRNWRSSSGSNWRWRKGRGIALTEAGEQLHALAREQLLRLSDFKRASAGQPVELTVAAGESLIEWLLLPRLGRIRGKSPNTTFRFLNLPTAEIASRLRDGTVDLGLVRAGSLVAPLKAAALGAMTFSLFVPAQARLNPHGGKVTARVLSSMPLATLEGAGHFRQELEAVVSRAKCRSSGSNWDFRPFRWWPARCEPAGLPPSCPRSRPRS